MHLSFAPKVIPEMLMSPYPPLKQQNRKWEQKGWPQKRRALLVLFEYIYIYFLCFGCFIYFFFLSCELWMACREQPIAEGSAQADIHTDRIDSRGRRRTSRQTHTFLCVYRVHTHTHKGSSMVWFKSVFSVSSFVLEAGESIKAAVK